MRAAGRSAMPVVASIFDAVRDGAAQAFNDPDAPAGSVEMMMRLRCIQLGRCAIRLRQLAKVAEAARCTV
ncbi:MAG: hypothetical protein WAM92_14715 [Mycobacterium sp.]